MKTFAIRSIALVVFGLLAPSSAWAQAQWGEPINTSGERFIVLASYNDQAVYDKETGLVWEQSPENAPGDWLAALAHCVQKTTGNRRGWRLPTVQELTSLTDPTVRPLPAGHPFNASSVQSSFYWSASTRSAPFTGSAWAFNFSTGVVGTTSKIGTDKAVWCVRSGQGVEPQ